MFKVTKEDCSFVMNADNFDSAVKKVVASTEVRITVFIVAMICAAIFVLSIADALTGSQIMSTLFVPIFVVVAASPFISNIYANKVFKRDLISSATDTAIAY